MRLFVALEVPEAVRENLASRVLDRGGVPGLIHQLLQHALIAMGSARKFSRDTKIYRCSRHRKTCRQSPKHLQSRVRKVG